DNQIKIIHEIIAKIKGLKKDAQYADQFEFTQVNNAHPKVFKIERLISKLLAAKTLWSLLRDLETAKKDLEQRKEDEEDEKSQEFFINSNATLLALKKKLTKEQEEKINNFAYNLTRNNITAKMIIDSAIAELVEELGIKLEMLKEINNDMLIIILDKITDIHKRKMTC
ncbi:hypothetical protein ACFLYA_01355, partial [Candidatus Dependentiae bacterium]